MDPYSGDPSLQALGDGSDVGGLQLEGWPAEEVFAEGALTALGFDDLVLLPASQGLPASVPVDLKTRLTGSSKRDSIRLHTPIIGGPSDAVTEVNMSIALALVGGIGIIHKSQSIEAQAEMVTKVKQFERHFILDVETLAPHNTVAHVLKIKAERGFSSIPITNNGNLGGKLMGMVTSRDVEAADDPATTLASIMIDIQDLVVIRTGGDIVSIRTAFEMMEQEKVGKLPVVNEDRELQTFICRGDMKKTRLHPHASRHPDGSLLVGAAIGANDESDWARADALFAAGVDVLCVDTDDGTSEYSIELIKRLKRDFQDVEIIAGRVSSIAQARELMDAGADALRVGSRIDSAGYACGTPPLGGDEATHLFEVAEYARKHYGATVIADSGLLDSGQLLKALCLGASAGVLNSLLAGAEEAPGDIFYRNGVRVKIRRPYDIARGQVVLRGSAGAGVEVDTGLAAAVVDKGSVERFLPFIVDGVRQGMRELACATIAELHTQLGNGTLRMERQYAPARRAQPSASTTVVAATTSSLSNRW